MAEKTLKGLDKKYIWHPFTQMKEWLEYDPLIITHADGNYLYDTEGNRYFDGVASIWCNIHGHRKKEIDDAIREQLEKVAHSTLLGLSNVPAIELAKRLISVAPEGLTRVFYSDNGSTAVEIALKMSFQYWKHVGEEKKEKFVAFTSAYHGDTIGSVSVGGIDLFHGVYAPLLFKVFRADYPYCYRCNDDKSYPSCHLRCLKKLEAILSRHQSEIAALIIEPMLQAASGMVLSPPGLLKEIYKLCKKYRVHFIADEVATGFGRTGMMFACEHEGIEPDFLCLAKGITGGYMPLAATLTTEEVFGAFLGEYSEFKTFFHGHTYTGNPLGCAAAIANIDLLTEDGFFDELHEKIVLLKNCLERFNVHLHVGEVRQIGLVAAIELIKNKATKTPYRLKDRTGFKVAEILRKKGALLRPLGSIIVLMPPLSITKKEIKWLTELIYEAIDEATLS